VGVPVLLLNQPSLPVTKMWFQAGTNHLYHTLKHDWKYSHSKFDATAKVAAKMLFCSISLFLFSSHQNVMLWYSTDSRCMILKKPQNPLRLNKRSWYIITVLVVHLSLDGLNCCNSCSIGCFVSICNSFVHPLLYPCCITCFLSSSLCFLYLPQ